MNAPAAQSAPPVPPVPPVPPPQAAMRSAASVAQNQAQEAPPSPRRKTASAFEPSPNQEQRSVAAHPQQDPGLMAQIRAAIRKIIDYFINLIRAIFGHGPRQAQANQEEQVVGEQAATQFAENDPKNSVLGQDEGFVGQKDAVAGQRAFAEGHAAAGEQAATQFAGHDPEKAATRQEDAGAGQRAFAEGHPAAPARPGPLPAPTAFAAQAALPAPPTQSTQLSGDDPQRLFTAMTESLAQCVQACQRQAPLSPDADAKAYLQSMSSQLQGAIAGLRTQGAMRLDMSMVQAEERFEPGSGSEAQTAERWLAEGNLSPQRVQALREIASAQVLDVMSQVARLGMKEQVLQSDGPEGAALNKEIQQMLQDSGRTLAQASTFARAAGLDPANLVREVQMKLERQIEQDQARNQARNQARHDAQTQEFQDSHEEDGVQYRPA